MWKNVFLLVLTIIVVIAEIQESQKKSNQFFNVEYSTLQILTSQYSTVVLWLYDDEIQMKHNLTLSRVIEDVHSMKRNDSEIIFVQNIYSVYAKDHAQQFEQPGLFIIYNSQYIQYDQPIQRTDLVQWLMQLIQPQLQLIEQKDIESYFADSNDVRMLLIVSSTYEQFPEIRDKILQITKQGKLRDTGIQHFLWYNSSTYQDYYEPSLLLKTRSKPPVQYEGDMTDINQILSFMSKESLPLVYSLTQDLYARTFGGSIKNSLHLLYDDSEENAILVQQYQQTAFENKFNMKSPDDRCLFTVSTFKQNVEFWQDFGFTESTPKPQLVLTEIQDGFYFMHKTIYQGEYKTADMNQFIEDYRTGYTQYYYKTEEKVESNSRDIIQHLVGSEFHQKTQETCLVIAYQSTSQELYKHYKDTILKIFETLDKNQQLKLRIYKLDIVKNEVPIVKLKRVPSLLIVSKGQVEHVSQDNEEKILKLWLHENLLSKKFRSDL